MKLPHFSNRCTRLVPLQNVINSAKLTTTDRASNTSNVRYCFMKIILVERYVDVVGLKVKLDAGNHNTYSIAIHHSVIAREAIFICRAISLQAGCLILSVLHRSPTEWAPQHTDT